MSLYDFAVRSSAVADRLSRGEAGGNQIDAYLLTSAVLGGISSAVWPGNGLDKRRFVEAWASFADPDLHPTRVSLPSLYAWLRDKKRDQAAVGALLKSNRELAGHSARVLTGDIVDLNETQVLALCPHLALKDVRAHSYPVLFYKLVRCGVIHEYELSGNASPFAIATQCKGVSYVNVLTGGVSHVRRIHFAQPWLADIVQSVAATAATYPIPVHRLAKWWIDG